MHALQVLRNRRSVREYLDRPVSKELLADMVDCARLAASGRNLQPWEFVVVTQKEDLQRLADIADHGKHIATAGACVAVFCEDTTYYIEDGSAATQNLLLAAHAVGLGTCWIAGDKKEYAPAVAEMLSVPDGYKLVSLVSVGHPAETPTKEKRPLESVLHWERFGQHSQ